jgi:formylglycine-generating enzyme required for sulfatase activity
MPTDFTSSHRNFEPCLPFEPEMVFVPAGEFRMGRNLEKDPLVKEPDVGDAVFEGAYAVGYSGPEHVIPQPDFYIAKTPVTHAQYAAFLQDTDFARPKRWRSNMPPKGKEDLPIVYVSWHDAVAYCRWLVECTGKPYRLPTEPEWEKAARGTDGRIYPWGDGWDSERCNTAEAQVNKITPVGAFPQGASPYGVLDMAGNVWEWTSSLWGKDWYRPTYTYPYDATDGRESPGADDRVCRVLRGGSFAYTGGFARCAYRYKNFPQSVSDGIGFRVAFGNPF